MRHKYATTGLVLARYGVSEASADIVLLTDELGLVRARAQSVRKPGAKLASALQTLAQSRVVLVRGKEGWRLAGAVLETSWFAQLPAPARTRAGRVIGLLLRLAPGEAIDPRFYWIMRDFLRTLAEVPETLADAAESLAALRFLRVLGLDAGELPEADSGEGGEDTRVLEAIERDRSAYIARINRGIAASGL